MTPTQRARTFVSDHPLGTLASAVAVLTAAGYVTLSPKQQIEQLSQRIDVAFVKQVSRDSAQDVRIAAFRDSTTEALRDMRGDIEGLVLARCIETRDRTVFALLKCARRMGRSP